jgi:hypothetical protein
LEFLQSICCYGFRVLRCRMCCWEGLMDLGMKIYIFTPSMWVYFFFLSSVFFCFQARAKHDIGNTFIAGCATGGTISAKGNPLFHSFSVIYYIFVSHNLYLRNEGQAWPDDRPPIWKLMPNDQKWLA